MSPAPQRKPEISTRRKGYSCHNVLNQKNRVQALPEYLFRIFLILALTDQSKIEFLSHLLAH